MRRSLTAVLLVLVVIAPVIRAANLTRAATATATITALAKLTLSSSTLAFASADPDTVPSVPASGGPLLITAKARTNPGGSVQLLVQAGSDLRSGMDVIPISQLSWTASGAGFVAGTMSATTGRTVASWVSSGSWTGSQSYALVNSWGYTTGNYSTTLTYTLTAP
jgi:hypothetical protein